MNTFSHLTDHDLDVHITTVANRLITLLREHIDLVAAGSHDTSFVLHSQQISMYRREYQDAYSELDRRRAGPSPLPIDTLPRTATESTVSQ